MAQNQLLKLWKYNSLILFYAEDSRILHATETRNTKNCRIINQLTCAIVVINALPIVIQAIILPLQIIYIKVPTFGNL